MMTVMQKIEQKFTPLLGSFIPISVTCRCKTISQCLFLFDGLTAAHVGVNNGSVSDNFGVPLSVDLDY